MGSALAAHREVARQAESPFADDVALDVRRPDRDRIAEAAHALNHPFFGAARHAVAAAVRTRGYEETMLPDQNMREQLTVATTIHQQNINPPAPRPRNPPPGRATSTT